MNSSRHSRRAARKPEVRSGIGRSVRYDDSQFKHRIADSPAGGGLRSRIARAHHEVVVAEPRHEPRRIAGAMLPIAIDNRHPLARGSADRGLDRRPVALVIGMTNHARARILRRLPRAIGGSIVDHEDLVPIGSGAQLVHDLTDALAFVEGGHDDRHGIGSRHLVTCDLVIWRLRSVAEVDDVAVLDDVFLAFEAELAFVT